MPQLKVALQRDRVLSVEETLNRFQQQTLVAVFGGGTRWSYLKLVRSPTVTGVAPPNNKVFYLEKVLWPLFFPHDH